jgi:hypothetical protein
MNTIKNYIKEFDKLNITIKEKITDKEDLEIQYNIYKIIVDLCAKNENILYILYGYNLLFENIGYTILYKDEFIFFPCHDFTDLSKKIKIKEFLDRLQKNSYNCNKKECLICRQLLNYFTTCHKCGNSICIKCFQLSNNCPFCREAKKIGNIISSDGIE